MKQFIKLLSILSAAAAICCSCEDFLSLSPKDKITAENLLSSDGGINAYMAKQYQMIPIEDFRYCFTQGGDGAWTNTRSDGGKTNMMSGPEASHSEWGDYIGQSNFYENWDALYKRVRSFNELKDNIPFMKPSNPATIEQITGEYYFMMAYTYFALAKRYGGVPIIESTQEYKGDYEEVKVPRSTEVETWKFVLRMCDEAIKHLPDAMTQQRASKWAAYALKSRAALYAASVGKFWNRDGAGLTGEAVTEKLVGGFTQEDINFFYKECMTASAEIIKSGKFSLNGGENPSTLEEASENYRKIFIEGEGMNEVIFLRSYVYPGVAHSMGWWHMPNQQAVQFGARCQPTLQLVESYPVIDPVTRSATYDVKYETTTDGNEDYVGWDFNSSLNYKLYDYDNPLEIFKNRDPRLYASVILPFSKYSNQTIIVQGGIRRQDGSMIWKSNDAYEFGGKTYYGLGSADKETGCSGWVDRAANGIHSGFCLRKYLQDADKNQSYDRICTPFVDLRFGEVLMNYAEAVAESGLAEVSGVSGAECLNRVRHRAGFTDNQPCTAEIVRKERRAEMALDYYAVWDYMRRRELHNGVFDGHTRRQGLMPVLDFTTGEPKYIFVRINSDANHNDPRIFEPHSYYRPIPGISGNSLIQNPNY